MFIVAILHVLIGIAFVTGFAQRFTGQEKRDLDVFDVTEPPPPEEEPPPPDEPVPEVQSPEIVTPPPMVRPPVPPPPNNIKTQTNPNPNPNLSLRADEKGEAVKEQPRPTFTCWNGQAVFALAQCPPQPPQTKTCPNGQQVPVSAQCPAPKPPPKPPTPVRLLSGSISNADYPSAAIRAEAEGVSRITLTVGPDGRATGCSVSGSSGNSALDSTACRLARSRFRFQAATRDGQPTAGSYSTSVRWQLQN